MNRFGKHFVGIFLTIFCDAILRNFWFGWFAFPYFSTLYLLYLGIRAPAMELLVAFFIFAILVRPFHDLSLLWFVVVHGGMLFSLYQLRSNFFSEAYLTYSLWSAVFVLILQTFLLAGSLSGSFRFPSFTLIGKMGLHAIFAGVLSLPLYVILDQFFSFQSRKKYHAFSR